MRKENTGSEEDEQLQREETEQLAEEEAALWGWLRSGGWHVLDEMDVLRSSLRSQVN